MRAALFGLGLASGLIVGCAPMAEIPSRPIVYEIEIPAPVGRVWDAWTTEAGLATFFPKAAHIELKPQGAYELFMVPENPKGQRGSEDTIILGFEPERMLSVSFSMPPYMPKVRPVQTHLQLFFEPKGADATRLILVHEGFGQGPDWDQARAYFVTAWSHVLPNLEHRFKDGPIDQSAMMKVYKDKGTVPWWSQSSLKTIQP